MTTSTFLTGNGRMHGDGAPADFDSAVPLDAARALLGFGIDEAPLSAQLADGSSVEIATHKSIVRLDTRESIGIVGQGYKVHDYNRWLIDTVADVADQSAGALSIQSAGTVRGGAVGFVTFAGTEIRGGRSTGVEHVPYILAATSLDGSLSSVYKDATTLPVCENTLSMALGETTPHAIRIRHTRNSQARIGEIRTRLDVQLQSAADELDAEIDRLLTTSVSEAQWAAFTREYAGVDPDKKGRAETIAANKVGTLNRLWYTDPRVHPWQSTAWGVVQAVNTAVHHEFTVKGVEREERNLTRSIMGEWDKVDNGTLALLDKVLA